MTLRPGSCVQVHLPPLVGTEGVAKPSRSEGGIAGVPSAVAASQLTLQFLAVCLDYRRGLGGGTFSVCDFIMLAVSVGWYLEGASL